MRRNFVALVVVALMVSFCGTPPEAGDLRTATGEQEVESKSNKVAITAVAVGAGVLVCYFGPVVKSKCKPLIKSALASGKDGTAWITKRVGDGIKKVGEKVKQPFRKKSADASATAKETVDDASSTASKGNKAADEGADS